jgi:hypothetical protein
LAGFWQVSDGCLYGVYITNHITSGIITKTMDTTALAQSGFSDLGALCQAIRSACDKHTNPYHLAGIGQYLADDWINTLDGELETLAAMRQTQQ